MCEVCGKTVCPSGCPNALREETSKKEEYICTECGNIVPQGALFYCFPEGTICAECAELLDTDRILRLMRYKGTYALLDAIGAVRRWRT